VVCDKLKLHKEVQILSTTVPNYTARVIRFSVITVTVTLTLEKLIHTVINCDYSFHNAILFASQHLGLYDYWLVFVSVGRRIGEVP